MGREWSRFTVKATVSRMLPWTPKLCLQIDAEKPMDSEMLSMLLVL
jgi:hypothetical protein